MVDDQLLREANPPNGQPKCPEPQLKSTLTGQYETLGGRDNAAAQVSACVTTIHQNGAGAAADGVDANVLMLKTLTLQITGDSASRTVQFFASNDGVNWIAYPGTNLVTFAMATSTTGNNEFWQFEISGIKYFRARLDAVAGGTVTVSSNAVM